MMGFDPVGPGASPGEAANQSTPGGEIASRLAYTQKSRGQYLPGRQLSIASLHKCSAPVSETG